MGTFVRFLRISSGAQVFDRPTRNLCRSYHYYCADILDIGALVIALSSFVSSNSNSSEASSSDEPPSSSDSDSSEPSSSIELCSYSLIIFKLMSESSSCSDSVSMNPPESVVRSIEYKHLWLGLRYTFQISRYSRSLRNNNNNISIYCLYFNGGGGLGLHIKRMEESKINPRSGSYGGIKAQ